jgi:signal transduction histidine kinase
VNLVRFEIHDRPAWRWQPIVVVVLVGLLAVLATLQYRWLGEVRDAERDRMRASLRTRATDFAQEFDAELTRTYMAFHLSSDQLDEGEATALARAFTAWTASAKAPGLVKDIYLASGVMFDSAQVRRFDPARGALEATQWPAALAASLGRAHQALPRVVGGRAGPPPLMMADAIDSRTPALIIAVPRINHTTAANGQMLFMADSSAPVRVVVVVLDGAQLQHQLLEPLVAKYFGEQSGSEYVLTVTRRDDESSVVFNSAPSPIDSRTADVTTGMFDLRMDQLSRLAAASGNQLTLPMSAKVAVTIVRRTNGPEAKQVLMTGGDDQGAWIVRARHREGSLDAVVTQSRRRNMAISMGVLALLGASFLLVIASAQRQRRLARQQMVFVAAVSHELRTPLAVICSAAENLSDGVVADGAQVKRYGSLIQTEGRRLGDMVERVMAFAGMSSGAQLRSRTDVDMSRIIAEAVDGVRHDAQDRGVTIALNANGTLPAVSGDADALRSAVQNVVGNAVKYSPSGATVDVAASAEGPSLKIRVADHGLGIDAADLPHIFKPFYRGRRAVDAQIRGSGVGLSVVSNVVAAHRGTIHVDSRAGEGTTITIALPLVAQPFRAAN